MSLKAEELNFDVQNRAKLEKVHEGERFNVYSYNEGLYIECFDHYASQDLARVVEGKHSMAQLVEMVNIKDVIKIRDFPEQGLSDEDEARFKKHQRTAYNVKLIHKHWAELYFDGIQNSDEGDGEHSIDIANYLRNKFDHKLDPTKDLEFNEYAVVLYELEKLDPDFKTDMITVHNGCTFGGNLESVGAGHHWMYGPYITVQIEAMTCFRKNLMEEKTTLTVYKRSYKVGPVGSQDIRRITDEEQDKLETRGKAILDSISDTGISFVQYTGEALVPFFFGPMPEYVDDRVIIDPTSLYTVDTSKYKNMVSEMGFDPDGRMNATQQFDKTIEDKDIWRLFPYSFGYLFSTKKWAMMDLSHSNPINFRSDSIEKLVLDQDKKDMLLALVQNFVTDQNDIVDGKGGGIITLLHGAPGLGKTLAAECIAEYTEKPLYKVSVGELGTSPDQLEQRLSQILNIATRWGAVLLIDEADIFLEARTTNDIARNAMVAIFLRLLEYYEGVLFLTTNRVANFDPAFYSRIMLSFGFNDFGPDDRRKVWNNLLGNSSIEIDDKGIETLVQTEVNARQIKNAINGARAVAKSKDSPVLLEHIQLMLDNTKEFMDSTKNK